MKSRVLFLAVTLFVCVFARAATAVIDNAPLVLMSGPISGLRTADFNGDGRLDFVVLVAHSPTEARLCTYRGVGDGSFDAPVCTSMATGGERVTFEVGSLDGDSYADAVVLHEDRWLQGYRGSSSGALTPAGTSVDALSIAPSRFAVADVTGDGRDDVIGSNLTVLPNLGSATFGTRIGTPLDTVERLAAADMNSDGKRDVVAGGFSTTLYLGNGNGTFQKSVTFPESGRDGVAVGDFDANGRPDVAMLDGNGWIRPANADGTFGAPVDLGYVPVGDVVIADLSGDGRADLIASDMSSVITWIMGSSPVRAMYAPATNGLAAAGDFDGDGSVDVLAGHGALNGRGTVSLLRGSPEGRLQAPRAYGLSAYLPGGSRYSDGALTGAAASDVTGDQVPDLVTVASDIAAIAVFAGRGDGTFDDVPELTVIPNGRHCRITRGDLDGNGAVDVLVHMYGAPTTYSYLANGDGTYRQVSQFSGDRLHYWGSRTTGDFNGDQHLDFVQLDGGKLSFYAGAGDGTFAAAVTGQFSVQSDEFLIGDVNDDGRDDLVLSQRILLGGAAGSFTSISYTSSGTLTAVADLTADGKLDLVFTEPWSSSTSMIRVYPGAGDGTFPSSRSIETSRFPAAHACAGDFSGDGRVDLAIGSSVFLGDGAGGFAGFARIHRAEAGVCSATDFDGNGIDDLLFSSAAMIAPVPALTVESLELPLSVTIENAPASVPAGTTFDVSVRIHGLTQVAPSGAVVLSVGGTVLRIDEPVDGVVTLRMSASVPGAHTLVARYGGDDVYAGASAERPIEITRATTTMETGLAPNAPLTTDSVQVFARIHSQLWPVTGSVTLFVNDVQHGTAAAPGPLFTLGTLPAGQYSLRFEYSGDATHLPITATQRFSVVRPPIAMNVSFDPPNGVWAGTPVTVTVTFPEEPSLTGWVYIGVGQLVSVPISGGTATLTTSTLPATSWVRVFFPGNDKYGSTGQYWPYLVYDAPIAPGPTSLYLVAPCRVLDTRLNAGNWIRSNEQRSVTVVRQCGIPFGAKAVAMNVTIVNPQGTGYVTLFPAASPMPLTSTMNYRPGKTRANNAVLPLSAGGMLKVFNSGPASVDVIIDVTGYFQ